jgi:hypothetical protein
MYWPPASAEVKKNVDLYIHSPIRLHGVVLNELSTGTALSSISLCTRSGIKAREFACFHTPTHNSNPFPLALWNVPTKYPRYMGPQWTTNEAPSFIRRPANGDTTRECVSLQPQILATVGTLKQAACYEMLHRASHFKGLFGTRPKQRKADMSGGSLDTAARNWIKLRLLRVQEVTEIGLVRVTLSYQHSFVCSDFIVYPSSRCVSFYSADLSLAITNTNGWTGDVETMTHNAYTAHVCTYEVFRRRQTRTRSTGLGLFPVDR